MPVSGGMGRGGAADDASSEKLATTTSLNELLAMGYDEAWQIVNKLLVEPQPAAANAERATGPRRAAGRDESRRAAVRAVADEL
jgi:hypothetical protein